jgi:hypothetical protein
MYPKKILSFIYLLHHQLDIDYETLFSIFETSLQSEIKFSYLSYKKQHKDVKKDEISNQWNQLSMIHKMEYSSLKSLSNKKINPYQLFVKNNYPKLKAMNPSFTHLQIFSLLSQNWKNEKKNKTTNDTIDTTTNDTSDNIENDTIDKTTNDTSDNIENDTIDKTTNDTIDNTTNDTSDNIENDKIDKTTNDTIDNIENDTIDKTTNNTSDKKQIFMNESEIELLQKEMNEIMMSEETEEMVENDIDTNENDYLNQEYKYYDNDDNDSVFSFESDDGEVITREWAKYYHNPNSLYLFSNETNISLEEEQKRIEDIKKYFNKDALNKTQSFHYSPEQIKEFDPYITKEEKTNIVKYIQSMSIHHIKDTLNDKYRLFIKGNKEKLLNVLYICERNEQIENKFLERKKWIPKRLLNVDMEILEKKKKEYLEGNNYWFIYKLYRKYLEKDPKKKSIEKMIDRIISFYYNQMENEYCKQLMGIFEEPKDEYGEWGANP